MKKIFSLTLILLTATMAFSQKVVDRKRRLTSHVTERYHAIIGDKRESREGDYQAFYRDVLIAKGQYKDDKKTGVWTFYDRNGVRVENFDYDKNLLLDEAKEDTSSNFRYQFDAQLKPTDIATKPVKPGGRYFGYIPYLQLCRFPVENTSNNSLHRVQLELLISPLGRIAEYRAHIYIGKDDIVSYIETDKLREEDRNFIPATLNGAPIASTIIIQCYTDGYGDVDMMNN